ncbi:MAG: retention module-containing protein, partial [Undibacterium sp.]|nr:retention module-containing protein [Undibacterium sp.]
MANSANIVGKVVALQGQASVRSVDGSQHQLKLGDVIYENDVIITAANGRVELSFDEGRSYLLRESETVTLDASVYAPTQSDVANAALLPSGTTAENIIQAVVGGSSLDKLLEETAAGLGGGDAGDGNGFVQLDRIAETVTPQSYSGGTADDNVAATNEGATAVAAADSSAPSAVITVTSVSAPTTNEGGNLDFNVKLSGASATETTLNLVANSGSATLGTDTNPVMVSVDGGLTFARLTATTTVPAGVTDIIVRIPVVNDLVSEGTETLTLSASTSGNASPVVGTGSITDVAVPTLSISGVADVNEGIGSVTYTVTLSASSGLPVSVNYTTVNGTAIAGSDFTPAASSLTFAPGELTKTFTVDISNDTVFEGAESFQIILSSPTNATISSGTTTTTIH